MTLRRFETIDGDGAQAFECEEVLFPGLRNTIRVIYIATIFTAEFGRA